MSDARRFEQQGEIIEAMWCYDAALKHPFADQDLPTLQAAGLGLGVLLMTEARKDQDRQGVERLLKRAIRALMQAHRADPREPLIALTLAEAHGDRYRHLGNAADVLAANLLLDQIGPLVAFEDRVATLRQVIKTNPAARLPGPPPDSKSQP